MGAIESHRSALRERHAELDRRIEEEHQRPMPDSVLLATLKKQKLQLKQEMESI